MLVSLKITTGESKGDQGKLKGANKSSEELRGVKRSQDVSRGVKRSQEESRGVKRSGKILGVKGS